MKKQIITMGIMLSVIAISVPAFAGTQDTSVTATNTIQQKFPPNWNGENKQPPFDFKNGKNRLSLRRMKTEIRYLPRILQIQTAIALNFLILKTAKNRRSLQRMKMGIRLNRRNFQRNLLLQLNIYNKVGHLSGFYFERYPLLLPIVLPIAFIFASIHPLHCSGFSLMQILPG